VTSVPLPTYIALVTYTPLRIHSPRVVTPDGVRDCVVSVRAGKIESVREFTAGKHVDLELGDRWLLPGLVDSHVHVNEPGRESWEGFASATAAALAGGITTIVDMPLNSIPATTNAAAFDAKVRALSGKARCDVALWGGVIPGNDADLAALAERGVAGFKCFLAPSGVAEFPHVSLEGLERASHLIAKLGLPLLVHAELPQVLDEAARSVNGRDPRAYATWLATRPAEAEVRAIERLVEISARSGCRVHVVHVSAAESIAVLDRARERGVRVSAETCPHYLSFEAGAIRDGATQFKCAPPIRDSVHREALWQALERDSLSLIASDHSPCPPELKLASEGDFLRAWGGIASLELSFAAVWTGARERGWPADRVVRWMSEAPAALAGLGATKGAIRKGADADLVVWNPEAEWTVDASRLHQRHAITPYAGMKLRGAVERVYLRGEVVFESGAVVGAPRGQFTPRSDSAGHGPLLVDAPRRIG
jgi:allantoinase